MNKNLLRDGLVAGEYDALNNEDLSEVDFSGADLGKCVFDNVNFSGAKLDDVHIGRAVRCNFDGASMKRLRKKNESHSDNVHFIHSSLAGACLSGSDLRRANLAGSNLTEADLSNCNLQEAELHESVILNRANLKGSVLTNCRLGKSIVFSEGISYTQGLEFDLRCPVSYNDFQRMEILWVDKIANWEMVNIFGKLPFFGISYSAIVILTISMILIENYNSLIERFRNSNVVVNNINQYVISYDEWMVFLSSICLAVASTIYRIRCPARIKEYTSSYWIDALKRTPISYAAESWKNRNSRIACVLMYIIGGLIGAVLIIEKFFSVLRIMIKYSFTS